MTDRIRKHSVVVGRHRTSISVEDAFWEEAARIAEERGLPINTLVTKIDAERTGNLSSAIRLFVLRQAMAVIQQRSAA